MNCTKAIILVAGYGTRRLPITKAIEKCMLPVLNRPIVDYVVRDCIAAGIKSFYFVMNAGSTQLPAYYSESPALNAYLKHNHKYEYLKVATPPQADFHYIEQPMQGKYGTAVPVWLCRSITDALEEDEQVLVIGGDQFIYNADGASETKYFLQAAAQVATHSTMLAVEVSRQEVSKYGIVATRQQDTIELFEKIVEKPSIDEAPSQLNNASFYLFNKEFFEFIKRDIERERVGEYFIVDVLNQYVQAGNTIAVIRGRGKYLDCGSVEGWLEANHYVYTSQT